MKTLAAIFASLMFFSAVYAQQPPPLEAPPPPGERPDGPGLGGPPPGPRGERGPGGPGGGYGGGMGMGGQGDPRMARLEMLRGYLDLVDRYARLAHDPQMSGIAAVVAAADILKPRGADGAIDFFNKALAEVKAPAVQRAIRLQLVELYKQAGKQDEALAQLKTLMTAEPSKEP